MCGILGIVAAEPTGEDVLRHTLRRMGLWQYHRGPDGWGEWLSDRVALGHNRLAILDLEHGQQPMSSERGDIQVVFNGEIYNFKELWRELESKGYRFRTDHSDTEVIVHGFTEWGERLFDRLEGMFAVGIWDEAQRRLVLGRDRLGIKPLYLAQTDHGLLFASEPKTLLASDWVDRSTSPTALLDYFMFRATRSPATLVRGIEKLSAGTFCTYDPTRRMLHQHRYWRPARGAVEPLDDATVERNAEDAIEDAVTSHLVSDVPLGVFLSGGVDSSLVAAMARKHSDVAGFTVGTHSPLDESTYAQTVADHLGMPLHVRWVTGPDFRDRFDDWAYHNDDPVSDPSALALMLLTEHARDHDMKVMLAGEGADELFGGYHSYLFLSAYVLLARGGRVPALFARSLVRGRVERVSRDYLSLLPHLTFFGSAQLTMASERASLFVGEAGDHVREWEEAAFASLDDVPAPLRAAMVFDQETRLPDDLLSRTDRATMAYSLEARVPFLDRAVVELSNGLRDRDCVTLLPPRMKPLLKRLAARQVPASAVYRKKRGFNIPLEGWLTVDFRERIQDFLERRRIDSLDYDYVADLYRLHLEGRHRSALLWAWLVLEQWHELWIDGAAAPRRPAIVADRDAYETLVAAGEGRVTSAPKLSSGTTVKT
jgi:asparagine synthase (glutamine-hydrolysing)